MHRCLNTLLNVMEFQLLSCRCFLQLPKDGLNAGEVAEHIGLELLRVNGLCLQIQVQSLLSHIDQLYFGEVIKKLGQIKVRAASWTNDATFGRPRHEPLA